MKLYGLEIDNISEYQLKENLKKIDNLQLLRIKVLKNKLKLYQQNQGRNIPEVVL